MNSIVLKPAYRLYAFSDYQRMKASLPYMQRVVMAKALQEVQETEARRYVDRITGKGFKNYLEPDYSFYTVPSALHSLITALQQLYKRNGYSARYIVIERG